MVACGSFERAALAALVVFLTQFISTRSQCDDVFQEQPGPVLEPLGTQVQLYCRVDMTHRTAWSITLPSVSSQIATSTETLTAVDFLAANHGIVTNVSSPENREPPLRINGTIENSETSVQCIAIDLMNPTARCQSAMVSAVFYDRPLIPENLTVTENGAGSLNISWISTTIDGVSIEFTINATNLNDSTKMMTLSTPAKYAPITLPDKTSCDIYHFQVTARNDAGSSDPSDGITNSFPSLPDISVIEDSLEHSLSKVEEGVELSITFNVTQSSCPDYPVANYTLVLENILQGGKTCISLAPEGGDFLAVVRTLEENSRYSFRVALTNDVGTVETGELQITTSEVQAVTFTRERDNTYFIQCSYLNGSDAGGCVYVLVSRVEGVENITGSIDRDTSGESIVVANLGCYSEVLAYVNITGGLPTRASVNIDMECSITSDSSGLDGSTIIYIAIGAAVFAVIVVVALIITVILYAVIKKGCCSDFYDMESKNNGVIEITQGKFTAEPDFQCEETPQYSNLADYRVSKETIPRDDCYSRLSGASEGRIGRTVSIPQDEDYSQLSGGQPMYQVLEKAPRTESHHGSLPKQGSLRLAGMASSQHCPTRKLSEDVVDYAEVGLGTVV